MTLRLHHLAPSPNCMKVRLALGYKGIEFESVAVDPMDRTGLIAASGQSLTPVIEHGDVRLFDSGAILRYLDANFRDQGGRLFAEDPETHYAIERWERLSVELKGAVGGVFRQYLSSDPDPAACEAASATIHGATAALEDQLARNEWLTGDAPTAADFSCAPFAYYAAIPAADAEAMPVRAFFREHLHLGEGRDRTRDWVTRAIAFDR